MHVLINGQTLHVHKKLKPCFINLFQMNHGKFNTVTILSLFQTRIMDFILAPPLFFSLSEKNPLLFMFQARPMDFILSLHPHPPHTHFSPPKIKLIRRKKKRKERRVTRCKKTTTKCQSYVMTTFCIVLNIFT